MNNNSNTITVNLVKDSVVMSEEEIKEFYSHIDWDWLFDFVREKYGVGTKENKPVPELKRLPMTSPCAYDVELTWPEELCDRCGVLNDTFRSVKLCFFSTRFTKDVTYNKDMMDKFIAEKNFEFSYADCNGVYGNKRFSADLAFRIQLAGYGHNYLQLATVRYNEDGHWTVIPEKRD